MLARAFPFRKQLPDTEFFWNLLGMFLTGACFVAYGLLFASPFTAAFSGVETVSQWHQEVKSWPWIPMLIVNFALADLLNYFAHRALHTKYLWHFHAWHHAPENVSWMSGLRGSPVHVFINLFPYTLAYLIFPTKAGGLLGIAMVLLGMANQHWQHSNIRLPYVELIEKVFVTPRYHFVHHSAKEEYNNSNFAAFFTLWDRWFGTYTNPASIDVEEPLGLNYQNSKLRMMLGLPPRQASGTTTNDFEHST